MNVAFTELSAFEISPQGPACKYHHHGDLTGYRDYWIARHSGDARIATIKSSLLDEASRMYTLVTLADVVQIHPTEFHKPSIRSIEDFINTKYADKVIHKVGLCVGFHSLISASEGLIGHGTGIVNVNVDFRIIVFRPFKGEILRATITHSSPQGIYLSVDFYEDLVVPPETLFENTAWEQDEHGEMAFVWKAEDGEGGHNEFFFDNAESCMLRIEDEQWNDVSPDALRSQSYATQEDEDIARRMPPYLIRGSMMHAGLGPTLWWLGEGAGDQAVEQPADGDQQMNGT